MKMSALIPRYHWAALSFMLFFALQIGLQFWSGAYQSELGGHPDEASHYVTGLMVRDFMRLGNWGSPMEFAEDYYIHYPKVAFGHWPPFFYVVQATWSFLFGASRESILVLMAVLSSTLALSVSWVARKEAGALMGVLSGFLILALPLVQKMAGMVMAEVLLAVLMLWAILFLSLFLESGRWKYAVGFSVFASLAALTKGNGLAVMLVPFVAVVLARRFDWLKSGRFWAMVLSVLVLCGPFYWATLDMARNGWQQSLPSVAFSYSALGYYSGELFKMAGVGVAAMVFIGVAAHLVVPFIRGGAEARWSVLGGLAFSVLLFQYLIPCGLESRHLIPLAPSISIFAVLGMAWAAQRLARFGFLERSNLAVCVFLVALLFSWEVSATPRKSWSGFGDVAERLLKHPGLEKAVFMVASDSVGEGVFVSEVAMREERPFHVVLRASKMLANSRWDGSDYELMLRTPAEVMDFVKSVPVQIVLVDRSVPPSHQLEHLQLLDETLQEYGHLWELVGAYPINRQGRLFPEGLFAYRMASSERSGTGRIIINMEKMLGRNLEKNL